MSYRSLLTPKNTLIILSSIVILAATFIGLNQVQQTQQIESEAAIVACQQISSLDSISSLAKTSRRGSTFCVKVPGSIYRTALITAARTYIKQTKNQMIGEPIDTSLVSYNKIKGTFSYGPPFERKYVEFYHYYYIDTAYKRIQTLVTSGTIGGRKMSDAEKGTIESEANKIALYLWGVYSHFVTPVSIYNDANSVYVTFRVL